MLALGDYILNQQIILQSPRVLEQYNSTYISTDIVVQYRLYTGAIYISFQTRETLKTCSDYKFLQQNPQPVYVN